MNVDPAHRRVCKLRKSVLEEIESVVQASHAPVHNHRIDGCAVGAGDFHFLAAVGCIIPVHS